jgi:hypothetical protein
MNRSDEYALVAVQGPAAANIVQSVTGAKLGLLKYYHFVEGTVGGNPLLDQSNRLHGRGRLRALSCGGRRAGVGCNS